MPSRRSVSRPASRPSVTHGSGIGSHGRVDLRDLDEVVHQRDAGEARLGCGERDVRQPASRVLAPREARELQHDVEPGPRARRSRCGGLRARGWTPRRCPRTLTARSQPSAAARLGDPGDRLQLLGEHPRRHRPVALRVASPAQRRRRVEHATTTALSPCVRASSSSPVGAPASRPSVSTTVVSPRRSRAATIWSSSANASVDASRSCRPLPTSPRRSSDETISAAR